MAFSVDNCSPTRACQFSAKWHNWNMSKVSFNPDEFKPTRQNGGSPNIRAADPLPAEANPVQAKEAAIKREREYLRNYLGLKEWSAVLIQNDQSALETIRAELPDWFSRENLDAHLKALELRERKEPMVETKEIEYLKGVLIQEGLQAKDVLKLPKVMMQIKEKLPPWFTRTNKVEEHLKKLAEPTKKLV